MLRSLIVMASVVSTLVAQGPSFMQVGNVVHSFGGASVALLDTALQTTTPILLTPGGANATQFSWDRLNPDDLIVWSGSNGLLYRTTVLGTGSTSVQLSAQTFPGVGGVVQLSWDQVGNLVVVGNTPLGQINRVDPINGTVSTVLNWPFASSIRCGRQDPTTGDYWLGNQQGLWRISGVQSGTPSVTLVLPTPSPVDDLSFDAINPQFLVYIRSGNLHRLNTQNSTSELILNAVFGFSSLATSEIGDLIVAASRNVYRVPNPLVLPLTGVIATLLGGNQSVGCCANSDLEVIGNTFTPFRLSITSSPGAAGTLEITNPPAGFASTWLFLSATTPFARGSGPFLGIVPDGLTLTLIATYPTPAIGNPFHSLGAPPPFIPLPPGSLAPFVGQTWDGVVAAFAQNGSWVGRSNVARVTWQ